ncbi:MAG: glycosyltransferase family 4 protein [Methanosarcinaceae archaeon]|nr:glycosyltransferase family 4 protein [Methanosarcinaceae archaeon]MDF1534019.1 glycosyltransferase family 4 protein [Methanosarcinaceae archaeon]
MESLRIGMFSWESLHSVKVGGIAPHVTEIAETLADKGHEVHIFTRKGWYRDYDEINGVHYQRCSHDQSGNVVHQMDRMCDSMVDKFGEVKKEFGDFDILHGHDWHPVTALNRIKEQYGQPYALTYHSTEWGRNGNQLGDWYEAREISHREWLGGYEASKVIITTDHFKQEVQQQYSIPDYKISVIPNGIFPGKIEKDVNEGAIKERFGIHPLAPVVLFVGRMNYQKGVDMLIRAIPQVLRENWGAHFVFIGEGEMKTYCENLAFQLGIQNSCHFLGYASNEVHMDWVNACNIVSVPSRNEPFGIVVLEAWDASKPVIATDAVHLVDNFSNGIVGYKTPESIAWGINYAMGGLDSSTKQMGINGKKLIDTKYNWDIVAKDTVKTYKNVVN